MQSSKACAFKPQVKSSQLKSVNLEHGLIEGVSGKQNWLKKLLLNAQTRWVPKRRSTPRRSRISRVYPRNSSAPIQPRDSFQSYGFFKSDVCSKGVSMSIQDTIKNAAEAVEDGIENLGRAAKDGIERVKDGMHDAQQAAEGTSDKARAVAHKGAAEMHEAKADASDNLSTKVSESFKAGVDHVKSAVDDVKGDAKLEDSKR
jgi:gas vesicle protein